MHSRVVMAGILLWLGVCLPTRASLLRNGGFETGAAWTVVNGASFDTQFKRSGQRSLRVDSTRSVQVEQVILPVAAGEQLTVCGWVATRNVVPVAGAGYAFMAVYQFDSAGRLLQAHDFVQVQGTHPWTYAEYTFRVNTQAEYIAIRVGIYNASGTAWFDDVNLTRGERAAAWKEPPPAQRPRPYRAAILHDTSLPVKGARTPVQTFRRVLAQEGIELTLLNAAQLADPRTFHAERFDLLIVPTGASFPVEARASLLAFLAHGGDLLCTGGYAFDHLLMKRNGRWVPYADFIQQQLAQARNNLVPNGSFEDGAAGWEADSSEQCRIVSEKPAAGAACAQVVSESAQQGARFSYVLPVEPGGTYLIGAHLRTESVQGSGYAFLAVYQYDREGRLVTFYDFAQVRGTQQWKRYEERFHIASNAAKVVFHAGLFQASGQMWFDEVTCAPVPHEERINAHYGKPEDGLVIAPTQLTLFRPDHPLAGKRLVAAEGALIGANWRLEGAVTGYEATAQLRQNARWVPLVAAQDEYGRFAGVAGAFVHHFAGVFTDSTWAIFGVENRDIFVGAPGEVLLRRVVRLLRTGVYATSLSSRYALYERGEQAHGTISVRNTSATTRTVKMEWRLIGVDGKELQRKQERLVLPPGEERSLSWNWTVPQGAPDFVKIQARVTQGDMLLDLIESGFCVRDERILQSGMQLSYERNAFTVSRPDGTSHRVLLFGTDTYGNWFWSRSHNPLTWYREIRLMRDYGLHLFKNLQYHPQNYRFNETQWRQLDAVVQIAQRFGLPYMAGLLIGQDVVVDDATLLAQAQMCRQFAARYKGVPGLIYYLNGDFALNLKDTPDIRRLWNEFLRERYGTEESLRQAWAPHAPNAPLGEIPVQNVTSSQWYEVRTRDVREFQTLLMRRWVGALCEAIRSEDAQHPITSEYYQRPIGGIDLRLTMSGMDAANIGYFHQPQLDIAYLMATIKWNDMRFAGKTINIGEFGVKTHDAWAPERGGTGYHVRRSEWQQRQLFWWVVHAALALDVTKIQNWCWSDDPDVLFPWGVVWNNPLRAKPVLKLYRNLRFLADRVPREYRRANVVLVFPDNWRLGAPEGLAYAALMNAIECLLATNVPFDVANEADLTVLAQDPPQMVLMPFAYTLSAESVIALQRIAEQGGVVYLSGDPSTDPLGRRDASRLERLCGVRLREVTTHPSGLPQPVVEEAAAQRLSPTLGSEVYLHRLGSGIVLYTPIPWETLADKDVFMEHVRDTLNNRVNLYLGLLSIAGVTPPARVWANQGVWRVTVAGDDARRLVSILPRENDERVATVRVQIGEADITWQARRDLPCTALLDEAGQVLAATSGKGLQVQGQLVAEGDGAWMLVSMDNEPLSRSAFLVATMMDGGRLQWQSEATGLGAWLVEWQDGIARAVAEVPLRKVAGGWELTVQPTELILVCARSVQSQALREISFVSSRR
jgi:hypothetical protein